MNKAIEAKLLFIIETKDPYDARLVDGFLEMCYRLGDHDLILVSYAQGGYSISAQLKKNANTTKRLTTDDIQHVKSTKLVKAFEERFKNELKKRQEEARIAEQAHKAKMEAEFLAALGE